MTNYPTKELTIIGRFFIWLAGSSESVLRDCDDSERIKHEAIGAAILVPISFGFAAAFYTAFSLTANARMAACVGCFWACVIGIVDRTFLATYRKVKRQWTQAIVRLGVAALTSVVIAHPLVLWAFRDSIANQIDTWHKQETSKVQQTAAAKIDKLYNEKKEHLKSLETNLTELHARGKKADDELAELRHQLTELIRVRNAEVNGERGSRMLGAGKIARDLEENAIKPTEQAITDKQDEVGQIQSEIETTTTAIRDAANALTKDRDIASVRIVRDNELQQERARNRGDIIGQTNALEEIEGRNPFVTHARWSLFTLFLLVDSLALLSKLLCARGRYDDLLEREVFESNEDLAAHKVAYPAMALQKAHVTAIRHGEEMDINDAVHHALASVRGANDLTDELGTQLQNMLCKLESFRRQARYRKDKRLNRLIEEQADALVDAMRQAGLAAIHRFTAAIVEEVAQYSERTNGHDETTSQRFKAL